MLLSTLHILTRAPERCLKLEKHQNVSEVLLSTRIKDAGIAVRDSRGYTISILQGPEMGWRGGWREYNLTKMVFT